MTKEGTNTDQIAAQWRTGGVHVHQPADTEWRTHESGAERHLGSGSSGPKPSLAASVISGVSVKRSGTSRAGAPSDLFWCGLSEGSSAAVAGAGWGRGNMAKRGGSQQRRVV